MCYPFGRSFNLLTYRYARMTSMRICSLSKKRGFSQILGDISSKGCVTGMELRMVWEGHFLDWRYSKDNFKMGKGMASEEPLKLS